MARKTGTKGKRFVTDVIMHMGMGVAGLEAIHQYQDGKQLSKNITKTILATL